jgi:hypothetical protein
VPGRQLRKLHCLDHLCFHHWTFNSHLMSKHHGLRTVGSGGCDKYLQMYGLF